MKKLFTIIAVATIFIASCSKDQRVVNQLEGDWKITSIKENGVLAPDSTFAGTTYTFEKCKVKKDDCSGHVTEAGKSLSFTYRITDDGSKITINMLGTSSTGDILEHSKSKFVWKVTESGYSTETTLEKK